MLGPLVALLLLTSPAAGPVDQFCFSFDLEALRTCQQQQRQQTQLDEQQRRIDQMEQRERQRQWETPTYTTPGVSLPGSYTAPGVSLPGNYTAPGVSTGSSTGGSLSICRTLPAAC